MPSCGTCAHGWRTDKPDLMLCLALPPQGMAGQAHKDVNIGAAKMRYKDAAYPAVKPGWPPCGMYAGRGKV